MRYAAGILPVCPSTGRALVFLRSTAVSEPLTWAPAGGGEEPFDDGQPRWTAVREFIEEASHEPSGRVFLLATIKGDNLPFHLFVSIEDMEFEPSLDFENEAFAWLEFEELLNLQGKHPGFADMLDNPSVQNELFKMMCISRRMTNGC